MIMDKLQIFLVIINELCMKDQENKDLEYL